MSAYTDDMSWQGIACGQIYGFNFDPPWGPDHRCPGCQPRPDDAALASKWDRWHELDRKWIAKGESSSCPILRGEVVPRSYTNEERASLGHAVAPMPSIEEASRIVAPKHERCPSYVVEYSDRSVQVTIATRHGSKSQEISLDDVVSIEVPKDEPKQAKPEPKKPQEKTAPQAAVAPAQQVVTPSKRGAKMPKNQGTLF